MMGEAKNPGMESAVVPVIISAMADDEKMAGTRLRLYIARTTPNSVRAQLNLTAALMEMNDEHGKPELEIVDVFAHPKRAITDSVMITPTLIGIGSNGRNTIIGDLADGAKLRLFLQSL